MCVLKVTTTYQDKTALSNIKNALIVFDLTGEVS